MKRLNQEKVDLVLHTGDYIAGFAVQHLRSLEAPLIGVFGNNDGDQELLKEKFKELGAELRGRFAEITVGDRVADEGWRRRCDPFQVPRTVDNSAVCRRT